MSEQEFRESLHSIGIELNREQEKLFSSYADYLIQYNEHTNLTAIKNKKDIYLKHFYDSLMLLKYKKLKFEKILDIGSGAGFPGIPLKIINPDIDLTLLDSNGKKTKFLVNLKSVLNIEYAVINDRAENYIKNNREIFDIVLSRAVTAMPALAELSIPFVKIGGYFIAYKGVIDESLENGKYAIETLGGKIENIIIDKLPLQEAVRSFAFIQKVYKTDEMYPRNFDRINKKPLQKLTK